VICLNVENFVPPGSLPNPGQSFGPLPLRTASDDTVKAVNSERRSTLMAYLREAERDTPYYKNMYCS
jgi:hypothetical protein